MNYVNESDYRFISHIVLYLKIRFGPKPRHISIGAFWSRYSIIKTLHENGAKTSKGADSVAWDGGMSSMAGLNLRSLETSLRPR